MRSWGSRSNMDYIRTLILATSLGCVPWTTDGVCTCSRNVSEMIPCLTLVSETVKLYECSSIILASVFDHWRRGRCMQNLHKVNVTSSQAYQATAKVQWRTEAGNKAAWETGWEHGTNDYWSSSNFLWPNCNCKLCSFVVIRHTLTPNNCMLVIKAGVVR